MRDTAGRAHAVLMESPACCGRRRRDGATADKRSIASSLLFCGSSSGRTPQAADGRYPDRYARPWGGNRPTAPLRDMVGRGLLLMLERAGEIEPPPRAGRPTRRHLHQRHHLPRCGLENRPVLQWRQTCRRESGRVAEAAPTGAGAPDPDVRRLSWNTSGLSEGVERLLATACRTAEYLKKL